MRERRKICGHCKKALPMASYHKDKHSQDGFHGLCKECRKPGQKKWRDANKDTQYEWYLGHKEYMRAAGRKYYAKHREAILAERKRKKTEVNNGSSSGNITAGDRPVEQ